MRTHLLTIGDEILIGQVIDTNTVWMAQKLMENGFHIASKSACGDTRESILTAIEQAEKTADVILMTGGLGPTKDDITKKVLCEKFGARLVFHPPTFEWIERYFEKIGRKVPEVMRDVQAVVPDNAEILPNRVGSAPGMWWQKGSKIWVSMPGVPFEMQHLMAEQVIPKLKKIFVGKPILHRTILTASMGESDVARRIEPFENALPEHIKLAYLPALGSVRLRLTGSHDDGELLKKQLETLGNELKNLVSDIFYGEGETSQAAALGEILKEKGLKFGTAESCTGGYVAHLLTSVAGASAWFPGSLVAYSYDLKMSELAVQKTTLMEHGAVSEQCVREMAVGALDRLGCDVALSISGIAGPDGGTPDKPVGTVWVAVADRERVLSRRFNFARDREKNIILTGVFALDLVRRFLLGTI